MARPKLGEGDTHRLQIKISDEELQAIEDWRYANRVPSRSEAVRRLCQIAMLYEPLAKSLRSDARQAAEDSIKLSDLLIAADASSEKKETVEVPVDLLKRVEANLLWLDVLSIDWKAHGIRNNPDIDATVEKLKKRRQQTGKAQSSEDKK